MRNVRGFWRDMFVLAIVGLAYCQQATAGEFVGKLVIEFQESGARLVLREDFGFLDNMGKKWTARSGMITDGASIPKAFWAFIGSPLDPPYVSAAIIHDQYCYLRTENPKDVHRMFYEAMLTAGVPTLKAKLMYAAVYAAGPWWDWRTVENARRAFRDEFEDKGWRANPKNTVLGHKYPPKEMFAKGPDGKPLICPDGCTWLELAAIEDNWISKRVPLVNRKTLLSDQQEAIAVFVQTRDPSTNEIDAFVDRLTQR